MSNIIFYVVFLIGLFCTLSALYIRASPKSSAAVSQKRSYSLDSKMKSIFLMLSEKLSRYIKLSSHRDDNLTKMLLVVGDKRTPVEFISEVLINTLLFVFLGIILAPFGRLYLILCFGFAGFHYWLENKKLKDKYKKIQTAIESDLPKFCSVIASMLNQTSVVIKLLEGFLPVANEQMKKELEYTLSDMKMSTVEGALLRLESRISSAKLSDVIRGLISVNDGNDQYVYFQTKQAELNQNYRTIKKRDISMRSAKLAPIMLALFVIFFALISYPLTEILSIYYANL